MVFSREDLRLSKLGEVRLGEWCRPALMVAAAAREDSEGERGDGGLGRASWVLIDMRRGRSESGEGEVIEGRRGGSEFRSGGMFVSLKVSLMEVSGRTDDDGRLNQWKDKGQKVE